MKYWTNFLNHLFCSCARFVDQLLYKASGYVEQYSITVVGFFGEGGVKLFSPSTSVSRSDPKGALPPSYPYYIRINLNQSAASKSLIHHSALYKKYVGQGTDQYQLFGEGVKLYSSSMTVSRSDPKGDLGYPLAIPTVLGLI